MRKAVRGIALAAAILAVFCVSTPGMVKAADSPYSGNFIIPESQSGFKEEKYETQTGIKLERGAKNFFLGWLEIPHGVKSEYYYRKQEYLPRTPESFFVGLFKGFVNAGGRMGVGLYEVFTFPYAQEPILEEMDEWLY